MSGAQEREALTDEQIIKRCADAGIQWITPDADPDGFPGGFDMCGMADMRKLLAACPAAAAAPSFAPETWRDMATAPKDGTLLRLLVEFDDHATEDSPDPSPTIGANSLDNTGIDEWLFAGWCWTQDCWTQGVGKPVGWLPMLAAAPSPTAHKSCLIPPLDDALREILGRPNFACGRIAELLRKRGHEIAFKAEAEQAAVIHWMLCSYAKHGGEWWEPCRVELQGVIDTILGAGRDRASATGSAA